jgi:hypothetical protein
VRGSRISEANQEVQEDAEELEEKALATKGQEKIMAVMGKKEKVI